MRDASRPALLPPWGRCPKGGGGARGTMMLAAKRHHRQPRAPSASASLRHLPHGGRRTLTVIALALLLAPAQAPAPAKAQDIGEALGLPAAQDTPAEAPTQDGVTVPDGDIATDPAEVVPDAQVAARLADIFSALESLSGVAVSVDGGVVTLSGTVPDAAAVRRAEVLASKTDGVVAVENALEEDVSVEGRLGPAADRARALQRQFFALLPLLAVAGVIVVGAWLLGALLGRQRWLWRRVGRNELIAGLIGTVVPVAFSLLGLVVALNILNAVGILSAVLGAAGVLGLAVGFAIRDTIENFIASVMLSLRQPFRPKDFVDVDGREGVVVRLTSRATILMTPDGNHLRIPNADVFKAVIVNYSRNPERRFTFQLGIDGADDPRAAIETGLETLRARGFVLAEPAPRAWIEEVGDSNIVLTFAPWIDQTRTDFLKAKSTAIRAVKITLEDEGFTLPEPIYRLRVDQVPDALTGAGTAPAPSEADRAPAKLTVTELDDDTAPDRTLERKVDADRQAGGGPDLLDDDAPTEFGDDGAPRGS